MADLDLNVEQVVLGSVDADAGYTHDSVTVTLTATMKQGSILGADGVELAVLDADDAVYVIDDLTIRRHLEDYTVGDELLITVASRGLILNENVCVFTDAGINTAGKTALKAFMNKFSAPVVDSTLV